MVLEKTGYIILISFRWKDDQITNSQKMNNITSSQYEPLIFEKLKNEKHKNYDFLFRQRILQYANILSNEYGGDIDIILVNAALIGLNIENFEFQKTYTSSDNQTLLDILRYINFPESKKIQLPFLNNDFDTKPGKFRIEENIVHDAVILATFGVYGISRLYKFLGSNNDEDQRNFDVVSIYRHNIEKLILTLSKVIAKKEFKFITFFVTLIKEEPKSERIYDGKYIILEGNSGTGKSTQAEILKNRLEKKGKEVIIVEEPTKFYKEYEKYISEKLNCEFSDNKKQFRLYSIIGDRYQQISDIVNSELQKGKIVISSRSFISMLVYQCENEVDRAFINYLHNFVPIPDIVILLDADEKICLKRALKRERRLSKFDKLEDLIKYRPLFLEIAKSNMFTFPLEVINSEESLKNVGNKILKIIEDYL